VIAGQMSAIFEILINRNGPLNFGILNSDNLDSYKWEQAVILSIAQK